MALLFLARLYGDVKVVSNIFELAVESSSIDLWIWEKCRGFVRSIYLRRSDCCWLLDTVEDLLSVKDSLVF